MLRLIAAAVIATIWTMPADAQRTPGNSRDDPARLSLSAEPPLPLNRRGIDFPIEQYVDERGAVQRRRGIVVSHQIAPNAMLGIGMFDRMPKSGSLMPQLDPPHPSRKTRGAAVGLKLQF